MWQNPKTDWTPEPFGESDLNRWEGNSLDLHIRQGNLSFEYFKDNNPDGWTITAAPGDSFALNAANAIHGGYCLKLSHAANVNDGIYALSQLFPISPLNTYFLGWAMAASVAALNCNVIVYFYDRAKQFINQIFLYGSNVNPTTMTYYIGNIAPIPANARYISIVLLTGYQNATAGDLFIDGLQINPLEIALYSGSLSGSLSATAGPGNNTVTDSEAYTAADIKLSNGIMRTNALPLTVSVSYQAHATAGSGGNFGGSVRVRVNDAYSPSISVDGYGPVSASGSHVFTVTSLPVTIELQANGGGSSGSLSGTCTFSISF